ncbi:WAP four-disulfide core domain 6B [Cricetulus griseus]
MPWDPEGRTVSPSTPQGTTPSHAIELCPRDRVKCEIEESSHCTRIRKCPDNRKCCMFACGKKCVDPTEGTCLVRWTTPVLLSWYYCLFSWVTEGYCFTKILTAADWCRF